MQRPAPRACIQNTRLMQRQVGIDERPGAYDALALLDALEAGAHGALGLAALRLQIVAPEAR